MTNYSNPSTNRPSGPNAISAIRRTLIYIIRVLVMVLAGCLICALAFLTAERVSNLYILSTEGMKLRAEAQLQGQPEENTLPDYFTAYFLAQDQDPVLYGYQDYTIKSFNYDLNIRSILVLPWSTTATVTAYETVTVNGSYRQDLLSEGDSLEQHPVPQFPVRKVTLRFINNGTRWYINDITTTDKEITLPVQNTPDPGMTPLPMATPTPIPDPTPTPIPRLEVIY